MCKYFHSPDTGNGHMVHARGANWAQYEWGIWNIVASAIQCFYELFNILQWEYALWISPVHARSVHYALIIWPTWWRGTAIVRGYLEQSKSSYALWIILTQVIWGVISSNGIVVQCKVFWMVHHPERPASDYLSGWMVYHLPGSWVP